MALSAKIFAFENTSVALSVHAKWGNSDQIGVTVTARSHDTSTATVLYDPHPLPRSLRKTATHTHHPATPLPGPDWVRIHGQSRRPPRRGGLRRRLGARPRAPHSHQADQRGGRRRAGRRQPGVRVHGVHPDGVDLEGRDGLECDAGAGRRGRQRRGHHGPAVVGRADGAGPLLLRARQPRHLQRPRAVHGEAAVLDARGLRWHRPAPRVVLQLRRDHRHGPAQGLRAAAVHRRAVAGHRRAAVQARRRRRQLRRPRRRLGVTRQGHAEDSVRTHMAAVGHESLVASLYSSTPYEINAGRTWRLVIRLDHDALMHSEDVVTAKVFE